MKTRGTRPLRERLLALIDRFERVRVLALVDLVADEYVFGQIARVSREAPVLILKHDRTQVVPGGGANAVNNIAALGGKALTIGVVGKDESGERILSALRGGRVDVSAVLRLAGYPTPTKTRILAGLAHSNRQQVVRIDRGESLNSNALLSKHLSRALAELLPRSSAVMVSDYGYGLITPEVGQSLARKAAAAGKLSTLDSRYAILSHVGFAAATPNEPEVESALGITIGREPASLERAGREMLRRLKCRAVLVTRGSQGMALFESGRPTRQVPIYGTDEVADVTGAGDTVVSTFTLALGAGASFYEAALLANYAGGIVVMKRGTATVSRQELCQAVAANAGE
jgi:rfaE bifunctional protein kinase chain/domain